MHLALICSEFPPAPHGGIGSYAYDLSVGLVERGHRVTVLGMYEKISPEYAAADKSLGADLRVIRVQMKNLRLYNGQLLLARWQLRRHLAKVLRQEQPPDLVESADYEGWLPFGSPGSQPLVLRLQGSNLLFDQVLNRKQHPLTSWLECRTLEHADAWLGVSRFALEATNRLVSSRVPVREIIPNSVDTQLFCPPAEDQTEDGLLLYVNSLSYRKGSEETIAMACRILPERPHTRLVMIGSGPTSFLQKLRAQIPPSLSDRIQLVGNLNREGQVRDWLRRAQVCLFPSKAETFGIAPVEAMSLEKPVIFMKSGPGPEVIEDGVSGLLIDTTSVDELTTAVTRLLDDPGLRRSLGQAARQRVLERFDKQQWLEENIAFYQNYIQRYNDR